MHGTLAQFFERNDAADQAAVRQRGHGSSEGSPLRDRVGAIQAGLRGSPRGSWPEFYAGRNCKEYRQYVSAQYRPFVETIMAELRPLDTVLEVGCGFGTVTRVLHGAAGNYRNGLSFVGMDNNQVMARVARKSLGGIATVIRGDIRQETHVHADVIHGHGVLEHFEDRDIAATLMAHRDTGARCAVHYVPGNGHGKPSFGDERLMPLPWWQANFGPTKSFTFNDGKDYCLIWRFK